MTFNQVPCTNVQEVICLWVKSMKYILFLNSPTSGGKGLVKLPSYVNLSVVSNQWVRFCPKFNPLMSFFTIKIVQYSFLYDSTKTACLGKIWFSSYDLKSSQPIRLQYLTINIWKESIDLLIFLHGDNHQEKVASETTNFFGWVLRVVPLVQSDCMIR